MPLRPLLVLALLLPALAGCTAPPPAPAEEPAAGTPAQGGLVPTREAAAAAGGGEQGDFAKSLDEKFHTHNYWGGAREKVLMDADVSSGDLAPRGSGGALRAFQLLFRRGAGFTPFAMPEGSIVPPEAERLEVRITWAESATITGLALTYGNASTPATQTLDPLPPGGGTYVIACDLLANDIPHTTVSKWRFGLVPRSDAGPALFNGTARVTITAFRNDTLFVAPPHRDFWGPNTTLPLLSFGTAARETQAILSIDDVLRAPEILQGGGDAPTGFGDIPLPNGTLIPPHTGLLTAVLRWQNNATLPNPDDVHPQLTYSSASSFTERVPDNAIRDGDSITYLIPVDARMWDSPYNEASQWAFVVEPVGSTPLGVPGEPSGFGQFDGWYTLDITAERETVA